MYGTNTGIGEFSETMLNDEQVKEFQRYLVYNHAAGIGDPAPIEHVAFSNLVRSSRFTEPHPAFLASHSR